MIIREYENDGLIYFTRRRSRGQGSDISNTYALNTGDKWYIIDTSCGRARLKEIRAFIKNITVSDILCTHYHNDHIANNGAVARGATRIIYHESAASKLQNLRTNATGQILTMYRLLDRKGMLSRMGYFSERFIRVMLRNRFTAEYIMAPLLYTFSYIFSLFTTGPIYHGRGRILLLPSNERKKLDFCGCEFYGWVLDDELYAIETPGHTDCHIAFYFRKKRILFTGDLLNFLTPNDIQFGDIEKAAESQNKMLALAEKDGVNIICQGHYEPLKGNREIIEYISGIIEKHQHVRETILSCINSGDINLPFEELYSRIIAINDPVMEKLAKITFPRSTLVFLDVYLYKLLETIRHRSGFH